MKWRYDRRLRSNARHEGGRANPDLTLNEKRAILASWASDACAVEASPDLREPRPGKRVKYDEIMEALRKLGQVVETPKYRKLIRRAEIFRRMRGADGGQALQ